MIITHLLRELRAFQDRSGDPTLNDVRARGVGSPEIRKYMQRFGWQTLDPDAGVYNTHQWQSAVPTWTHIVHVDIVYEKGHDEFVISALAKREERSAWAVLDDCAHYAGWQELYSDGEVFARRLGSVWQIPEMVPNDREPGTWIEEWNELQT